MTVVGLSGRPTGLGTSARALGTSSLSSRRHSVLPTITSSTWQRTRAGTAAWVAPGSLAL